MTVRVAACLFLVAACGCVDSGSRGAVLPVAGQVQAVEAWNEVRHDVEVVAKDVRKQPGQQFVVVGNNDFARSVVAAMAPALPEGWRGTVHVADGCVQVACLHWIAESEDGLRRVESLPIVFDSTIRNTTPDVVHHEAEQVRSKLDQARRQLFPESGGMGRYDEDPPDPSGYGRGAKIRWTYDHVRDGVPLRSVVETEAAPWHRPRDDRDAEVASRGMGVTIIDLQLRSIAFTAPASDPDPGALAWVANHFRPGMGFPADPPPGGRLDW